MNEKIREFIFLYPIPEIINFEIENQGKFEESIDAFRQKYKSILNQCIDVRYRKNGFGINYVIFNQHSISDVIHLQETDKIIEVEMDFKTHTAKQENGEYPYPDPDYILDQINGVEVIRIAGFHMWDCVEKLAKRAYEKSLDTLVDEDLTEFLAKRLNDVKIDKFPTYNPKGSMRDLFMKVRKNKPWLWQQY